jgi:hypothetical protein
MDSKHLVKKKKKKKKEMMMMMMMESNWNILFSEYF